MRMNAVLPLLTAVPIAQVAAEGFSGSCLGISYFSTSVKAFCFTADNEYSNDSSLDLRSCLANVGGQIVVSVFRIISFPDISPIQVNGFASDNRFAAMPTVPP